MNVAAFVGVTKIIAVRVCGGGAVRAALFIMALADFISLPLRILWSVSGFVLSHGWALVFTVAATIALAVIIHHRMKPSSRQVSCYDYGM